MSTHPVVLVVMASVLLIFLVVVLFYYVSLRSEFRVVMSVAISAYKLCSDSLYLQLYVGGLMSCLRYLCLLGYTDVQDILCCVPYVASISGLSIFYCLLGIL